MIEEKIYHGDTETRRGNTENGIPNQEDAGKDPERRKLGIEDVLSLAGCALFAGGAVMVWGLGVAMVAVGGLGMALGLGLAIYKARGGG